MKTSMFTRVCAFLTIGAGVIFAANAEVKWTYASNVLTGIAADGETAGVFALTDDGVLSVTTAGTQKVLDFRSAAMPEGVPVIKKMNTLTGCSSLKTIYLPATLEGFASGAQLPSSVNNVVFSNWIEWSKGTDNPFGKMTSYRSRFLVPSNNVQWVADMVDTSKIIPWAKCPGNVQNAYTQQTKPNISGADDTLPAGVAMVNGGIGSVYIVPDGTALDGVVVSTGTVRPEFGKVTVTPAPQNEDGSYTAGTEVTIKFEPAEGVTFKKWFGNLDSAIDATSSEINVTANGTVVAKPVFESTFLVYDKEAGELTDGDWTMVASGEKEAIKVGLLKRANVGSASGYDALYGVVDMSREVKGGGAIVELTTRFQNSSCIYTSGFVLPSTLQKTANNMFQSVKVPVTPKMPDSMITIGSALFADTAFSTVNGNFRVGFAKDADGNYLTTTLGTDLFTRGGYYMGPTVEFGPGITYLNSNTFQGNSFAYNYEGPIDVWFGPNLASAADGAMGTSIGGTNAVSFHFQGDMFAGTYKMFKSTTAAKSGYRYRFYIGAEGCPKWQAFITNTTYVTRWKDLEADIQAEYKKHFKGEPYGLTTAAAALSDGSGLPEAVWVFSLKPTGMCIRIQ
jgi:hypothetical protein